MIFLNIIILIIYIIFWFNGKKYSKMIDNFPEDQIKLKQILPIGLYVLDKTSYFPIIKNKLWENEKINSPLKALYIGINLEDIKRMYISYKVTIVLLIIFLSNFLGLLVNLNSDIGKYIIEGKYIQKPDYNGEVKKVPLKVNISEDEVTVLEEDITLDIEPRRYKGEEVRTLFKNAREYIDLHFLNGNTAADQVLSDLKFISNIPNMDITVEWITNNSKILDEKGKVHNENLTKSELIEVTSILTYYDDKEEYIRYVKVLPKEYTKEDVLRKSLNNILKQETEKSLTEEYITLPERIDNQTVTWAEKKDSSGLLFLLSGCIIAVLIYFIMDRDLYDQVDKRNKEMLLDYPEIINKFTLLVGAGMSLSNAWSKLALDYKNKSIKKRYAYEEMLITHRELNIGTSETISYERFGRRVKLLPYLRFSSLLAQNVKKGSIGLLNQLELEAVEAFEDRKELAKRLGEEAGTKLLLPMMLMLLIVLAIIMIPAFMSFNI